MNKSQSLITLKIPSFKSFSELAIVLSLYKFLCVNQTRKAVLRVNRPSRCLAMSTYICLKNKISSVIINLQPPPNDINYFPFRLLIFFPQQILINAPY